MKTVLWKTVLIARQIYMYIKFGYEMPEMSTISNEITIFPEQ